MTGSLERPTACPVGCGAHRAPLWPGRNLAEITELAELGDSGGHNATIIAANTAAMRSAIDLAGTLNAQSILAMHHALLGAAEPSWAGQFRTEQVWIGGDYSPHRAEFVPPHHERVPAAIADLEKFMARTDIASIAHAAVAHAQFETIHPFNDGSGRTGRALVHAMLRAKGLTRHVTVPVSAGLLTDTAAYFAALSAYRDGDPEPIVRRMADASFLAVNHGRQLVADLRLARQAWQSLSARRDATAWKVADLLLGQPVLDSPTIQRELGVTAPAALDDFAAR
jgi:Fic family protein